MIKLFKKIKSFIKTFRSLPGNTRKLLSLGVIVALTVALPFFIWAIVTQEFDVRKRAATGEPTPIPLQSPINWRTSKIAITADDFYVIANGKRYTGFGDFITVSQPDPGSSTNVEVNVVSSEYGDDMRLNIVFRADYSTWWVESLKTLNGPASTGWIGYLGPMIKTTLGYSYRYNGSGSFVQTSSTDASKTATVYFTNLSVQAFLDRTPPPTACPPYPMTLNVVPASKKGALYQTLRYDVIVTHNDPNCLGGVNVNLTANVPAGWTAKFATPSFYLAPNHTYYNHVDITSNSGYGGQPITINAQTVYPKNFASKTVVYEVITLPTPPPTVRPFEIKLKLQGVDDGSANLAKVVVRFIGNILNYSPGYTSSPLPIVYDGNGIYRLPFGVWSSNLPPANDYSLIIKGEKHSAVKFCYPTGQTQRCLGGKSGHITIPSEPGAKVRLDFTGIPLDPGDLPPQDGRVDSSDFTKIKSLMSKLCSSLTDEEKYSADLDYNGCINIKDAFLIRKTLEIRYDEN